MRQVVITSTILLTVLIILLDIRGLVGMWKPFGLQVHTPPTDYILPLEIPLGGLAWARDGAVSIRALLINADTGELVANQLIQRDKVIYRGQVLYELASFRSHITAPVSGTYILRMELYDCFENCRAVLDQFLTVSTQAPLTEFRMFSLSHWTALAVVLICAILVFFIGRSHRLSPKRKNWIGFAMYLMMLINEAIYHIYWQAIGAWSVSTALMLHMCGLSILLLPWVFIMKPGKSGRLLFEILYFWGVGGALQALFTPDIGLLGFPSYKYFSFFISHGLIILITVYASVTLSYKITYKSFIRALILSNGVIVVVYFINHWLVYLPPYEVGNYFVLSYPPVTGSIVDLFVELFGPSPWYFMGFEIMALIVFGMLVLPWYIAKVKT
ncbi:TIGR02206 family membrane protein [Gracilinema caldarium]|uniref:TIGR02206 family membrane protein n=1 Tax=Gracilinema caldarium (strain ATCC 51460 / DSM 7334 / H1) TaxID=744872 RepID=F8EZU5_GRAC1|nr:TIGR02206 family membrane protein [Gracilinema caldarium]AEJ18458.1 Conserved hypothetical protein CHP02206, TP0381 [Gracilinema caldarium DSM 7334]